jgi:hypothetical protein
MESYVKACELNTRKLSWASTAAKKPCFRGFLSSGGRDSTRDLRVMRLSRWIGWTT